MRFTALERHCIVSGFVSGERVSERQSVDPDRIITVRRSFILVQT
jgi:hypothetical protein